MHTVYIVCGKSGAGKTSLCEELQKEYGLSQIESYTTRKPRYDGETGHIFVDNYAKWKFDNKDEVTIAYTNFDKNNYWATKNQLEAADLYILDPFGLEKLHTLYHGDSKIITVYIDVSAFKRYKRMRQRGDSIMHSLRRIIHDHKVFKNAIRNADYIVNNSKDLGGSISAFKMAINIENYRNEELNESLHANKL